MAILLGTIVGGLAAKEGGHPALFGAHDHGVRRCCAGASSLMIPRTGAGRARPRASIPTSLRSTGALLKDLWSDQRLWWGGLVASWFWLVGAVVLSLLPPLVKTRARRHRGSRHRVPRHLLDLDRDRLRPRGLARARPHRAVRRRWSAPFCSAVFALDLGCRDLRRGGAPRPAGVREVFTSWQGIRIAIDLAGLAIAGGLFIVPSFAAVQAWAGADKRARVVAAVNVLNAAFIVGRRARRRRAAGVRA